MAEIIEKTGKSYNIFDKVNNVWNKISFWHKASDCEFNDGKTAQTKLGAIDGITSDLSGESETVAASIKCVNQLNSSLIAENSQQFQFAYDEQTQKYGYMVKEADTDVFVPFSSIENLNILEVVIDFSNTGAHRGTAYKFSDSNFTDFSGTTAYTGSYVKVALSSDKIIATCLKPCKFIIYDSIGVNQEKQCIANEVVLSFTRVEARRFVLLCAEL